MATDTMVPVAEKGVDVVLNGGQKEMDSATIPVQFFLSPEVISRKPKYVVFFEQDGQEAADIKANNLGRRYVCKVEDGVKFIQLFSPGYHRLGILVLGDEVSERNTEIVKVLLNTEGRDRYNFSIQWKFVRGGNTWACGSLCTPLAVTMVEFEVPAELFAEKPKSKLGQAVEKWSNGMFKSPPRDQCVYRRRVLFSFTLQPLIFLVVGLISVLYVLAGSAVAFFCGWRPHSVFVLVRDAVAFGYDFEHDSIRKYPTIDGWRVWKQGEDGELTMMLVTPYELLVAFPLGWASWIMAKAFWEYFATFTFGQIVTMLVLTAICLVLTWLLIWFVGIRLANCFTSRERKAEWERERKAKIAAEEQRLAQAEEEWLRDNLAISLKPDEVDLLKVPRKGIVQTFRIGYWALKAKMCKPYSR